MRGCLLSVMVVCLLGLTACPKGREGVRQIPPATTQPPANGNFDGTDTSSPARKAKRVVMAISPEGEKIQVHRLKSGNTPYRGLYSALDEWVWRNYNAGEEDLALQGKGIGEDETLRALYVTDDGYVIPNLEGLRFELDQRKAGKPHGAKPGPFALYAIGVLPDKIRDQNLAERARLTAEYMPPIPLWLSSDPPYWALILPDSSVVFKGKPGAGRKYFPNRENLHILDEQKNIHYTSAGMFIAQNEPGKLWCELFFPDFEEALKRHGIGRGNVREYGLYLQFLNVINQSKTGYYYYDGTPLSLEEISAKPDYNRLFEMYGKHIPPMYIAQKKKGG